MIVRNFSQIVICLTRDYIDEWRHNAKISTNAEGLRGFRYEKFTLAFTALKSRESEEKHSGRTLLLLVGMQILDYIGRLGVNASTEQKDSIARDNC